jgi:hypothetical protein
MDEGEAEIWERFAPTNQISHWATSRRHPPKAVHGGIFWRCGYSWSDLFGFSLTEDLGHQLSKVFFSQKSSALASMGKSSTGVCVVLADFSVKYPG